MTLVITGEKIKRIFSRKILFDIKRLLVISMKITTSTKIGITKHIFFAIIGDEICIQIIFQNGAHLKKKRAISTYFSHFLVTRGKLQKFLQHISHSQHTCIFLTLSTYFALPILGKKYEFIRYRSSLVWFLWLEQSINNKMVSKIKVGMSTTDMYLH